MRAYVRSCSTVLSGSCEKVLARMVELGAFEAVLPSRRQAEELLKLAEAKGLKVKVEVGRLADVPKRYRPALRLALAELKRYGTVKLDAVTISNRLGLSLDEAKDAVKHVVEALKRRRYTVESYPYGTGFLAGRREEVEQVVRVALTRSEDPA